MGTWFRAGARLILGAALVASACTVHQTSTPELAGPSEFALSLNVTATPDSLALDGGSQSAIVVETRDATGAPRPGVAIRMDIFVGSTAQDCGQLSARNVVTGTDGRATLAFTAPSLPLPYPNCANFSPGNVVTIGATPSGSNFQTANIRTATIRLVPTGVIVPPADTPTPAFVVSPAGPAASAPVSFNASTSCGGTLSGGACPSTSPRITAYSWSFGDGGTASGAVVSHNFTLAGTYNVTLTVTNDRGVSASTTQAVLVGASTSLPTALFEVSPPTPTVGQVTVFDASGSTPGAGHSIVRYSWVFGDGESKTGMIVSHDFSASGVYNVTLTVTDEAGQIKVLTKPVTVGLGTGVPLATFVVTPQSPQTVPVEITVDATGSSSVSGSTIVRYTWTFGDGPGALLGVGGTVYTSTTPSLTHQYTVPSPATPGYYTITLTVTDDKGRSSASVTRTYTVQ